MARLASTCFPRSGEAVREVIAARSEPDPFGGCCLWTGALQSNGYGVIRHRGASAKVHRVAYELARGEIPAGLTVDHLCRVRCCVNPAHLELVTPAENARRSWAHRTRPTHCRRGHEYTPENTARRPGTDWQVCRICYRDWQRKNRRSRARG